MYSIHDSIGYRRVSCEVDTRNQVARKFLERCTFQLEAILRKHKVVEDRNRDTAVYVILNSDWAENEIRLKKYLGWSTKPFVEKAADIKRDPLLFKRNASSSIESSISNDDNALRGKDLNSQSLLGNNAGDKKKKKKKKNVKNL